MEVPSYTAIWTIKRNSNGTVNYGFAINNDIEEDHFTITYAESDLTAEEVGQLLGGS